TLRGQVEVTAGGTAKAQLIVDDGLINRGYKVIGFYVWENSGSPTQFNAVLSTQPSLAADDMDASNGAQIAWVWQGSSTNGWSWKEYILDPDHVIVRDLYVTIKDASNDFYNYMIVVEEMSITADEAIINIIKEGSQSLP
ncbi:unnamed protein product, partial [marine sediment metagenome]